MQKAQLFNWIFLWLFTKIFTAAFDKFLRTKIRKSNRVGGHPLVEWPTSHTTVRTVRYTAVQSPCKDSYLSRISKYIWHVLHYRKHPNYTPVFCQCLCSCFHPEQKEKGRFPNTVGISAFYVFICQQSVITSSSLYFQETWIMSTLPEDLLPHKQHRCSFWLAFIIQSLHQFLPRERNRKCF